MDSNCQSLCCFLIAACFIETTFGAPSSLRGSLPGLITPKIFCRYNISSPEECPPLPSTVSQTGGSQQLWQTLEPFSNNASMTCIDGVTQYKFQYRPGSTNSLLIFFMGGGACWNQAHTAGSPFCTHEPDLRTDVWSNGAMDDADPTFHTFHILKVSYCSGDGFVGNIQRTYSFGSTTCPGCQPAVQYGYSQAKAAIDWIQFNVFGRTHPLNQLVIIGASAGAIGLHLWSRELISRFSFLSASIIIDSYAGVFQDGVENQDLEAYGTCSTPLVDAFDGLVCGENLTFSAALAVTMARFPKVGFASINSKADAVQSFFFKEASLNTRPGLPSSTNALADYYERLNQIFEVYASNENWRSYLLDGDHHQFTIGTLKVSSPDLFTALSGDLLSEACSTANAAACSSQRIPNVGKWIHDFVVGQSTLPDGGTTLVQGSPWPSSVCIGPRNSSIDLSSRIPTFCDTKF